MTDKIGYGLIILIGIFLFNVLFLKNKITSKLIMAVGVAIVLLFVAPVIGFPIVCLVALGLLLTNSNKVSAKLNTLVR